MAKLDWSKAKKYYSDYKTESSEPFSKKYKELKKRYKEQCKTNIKCPNCGKLMIKRMNNNTLVYFYGCSGYPKCKQTLPLKK